MKKFVKNLSIATMCAAIFAVALLVGVFAAVNSKNKGDAYAAPFVSVVAWQYQDAEPGEENWSKSATFEFVLNNEIPQTGITRVYRYFECKKQDGEWVLANISALPLWQSYGTQNIREFSTIHSGYFEFGVSTSGDNAPEYLVLEPNSAAVRKYFVFIDSAKPTLSIEFLGKSGQKVTNMEDLTDSLEVKETAAKGISGEASVVYITVPNQSETPLTNNNRIINQNGMYKFRAVSSTGISSDTLTVTISNIDNEPPSIFGIPDSGTSDSSVTVSFKDVSGIDRVLVNGERATLKNDQIVLSKNGTYKIQAFDRFGKGTDPVTLVIQKSNAWVYVVISIVGVLGIAAIVVLIVINANKTRAIRSLVASVTASDSDNQFVLMKRIRKKLGK
ncbi:MAG: hypothetical protein LBN25_04465 [Christensenellaceae bacterium]|jgi:hypothetical protein|nr:hypothetical protein [Christensenellaceae bacterium]